MKQNPLSANVILLVMRGCKKVCQRVSDSDNSFKLIRGKENQLPLKLAIIGPPTKRRFNGYCWRADADSTMNAGLVALRFSTGSRESYSFVIFQGGIRIAYIPLWIRACIVERNE